jgi:hypothetical protein
MKTVRLVPAAAVLLGSMACVVVQPVRQPAQFIPANNPEIVVVTYTDNSVVPVSKPHMSGDTLVGTWAGLGEPVAVPLSQVQRIDARQKSSKRTAMLIAGVAALAAGGTYAIARVTISGRNCDVSYQPATLPQAGGRCIDGSYANQ